MECRVCHALNKIEAKKRYVMDEAAEIFTPYLFPVEDERCYRCGRILAMKNRGIKSRLRRVEGKVGVGGTVLFRALCLIRCPLNLGLNLPLQPLYKGGGGHSETGRSSLVSADKIVYRFNKGVYRKIAVDL